ncbi:SufE family protein, partial [Thiomicrorhabdus chilensis]
KSAQSILDFDVESYFNQLDLVRHLSPTRGNGLRAMVQKIKDTAQSIQ